MMLLQSPNPSREALVKPTLFPPGIPTIGSYDEVLESSLFREIESFSDQFLNDHSLKLRDYGKKWVTDPLHQWSRQWEYPFAYAQIKDWLSTRRQDEVTILDAGSGVTFFPFCLASEFPFVRVVCCDQDEALTSTYASIINDTGLSVRFSVADLHQLPYADATCDIVFSISVLEHTDAYDDIFREFQRVLRPGGMVVITFDITLGGVNELIDGRAQHLLETAEQFFRPLPGPLNLASALNPAAGSTEILTTRYIRRINKKLLPWRYSYLAPLKNLVRKGPEIPFQNLTVFCQAFQRA